MNRKANTIKKKKETLQDYATIEIGSPPIHSFGHSITVSPAGSLICEEIEKLLLFVPIPGDLLPDNAGGTFAPLKLNPSNTSATAVKAVAFLMGSIILSLLIAESVSSHGVLINIS